MLAQWTATLRWLLLLPKVALSDGSREATTTSPWHGQCNPWAIHGQSKAHLSKRLNVVDVITAAKCTVQPSPRRHLVDRPCCAHGDGGWGGGGTQCWSRCIERFISLPCVEVDVCCFWTRHVAADQPTLGIVAGGGEPGKACGIARRVDMGSHACAAQDRQTGSNVRQEANLSRRLTPRCTDSRSALSSSRRCSRLRAGK